MQQSQILEITIVRLGSSPNSFSILCSKDSSKQYKSLNSNIQKIVQAAKPNGHQRFSINGAQYCIWPKGKLMFICKADDEYSQQIIFNLLFKVVNQFETQYSKEQIDNAIENAFNKTFEQFLAEQIKYYNQHNQTDLQRLIQTSDRALDVAIENLDKAIERTQKLKITAEVSDIENKQAITLHHTAIEIRRKMCWKNARWTIILTLIILLAIYLIISFICGFDFHRCHKKK